LCTQHVCTVSLCLCYTNSSFSPYARAYKIKYMHIVQIFTAFIYRKCTDIDLNIHPARVCWMYAQYIWCTRTCKSSISLNCSRTFVFKCEIFSWILNACPLRALRHIRGARSCQCVHADAHSATHTQRERAAVPKGANQPGSLGPSKSKGHACNFLHLGLYLNLRCNFLYGSRDQRSNFSHCR